MPPTTHDEHDVISLIIRNIEIKMTIKYIKTSGDMSAGGEVENKELIHYWLLFLILYEKLHKELSG